jgi:hypothetical protein
MHGAGRLVALTGLRQKRGVRCHGSARQRLSDRTVTGHYRHVIDVTLRIAEEAEAVDGLISETEALRAKKRRCCRLWQGRDPVGERLRNIRSGLISRPDLTTRWRRRRLARTLHVAPGQVGNRRTEKDRTRAIRLRENRRAAGGGSDRDMPPGRRAGRGGAKREIAAGRHRVARSAAQIPEAPQPGRKLSLRTRCRSRLVAMCSSSSLHH